MRLQDELYTITAKVETDSGVAYTLRLRHDSIIYKAHFPGQPITPGVCIAQAAVELAGDAMGGRLCLVGMKNVKFLAVISPDTTENVIYELAKMVTDGDEIRFQCTVRDNDTVFSKMSLICRKQH